MEMVVRSVIKMYLAKSVVKLVGLKSFSLWCLLPGFCEQGREP
jgi:hypothetical protein